MIMGTQEDNRDNAPLQLTTGTGPAGHTTLDTGPRIRILVYDPGFLTSRALLQDPKVGSCRLSTLLKGCEKNLGKYQCEFPKAGIELV